MYNINKKNHCNHSYYEKITLTELFLFTKVVMHKVLISRYQTYSSTKARMINTNIVHTKDNIN